MAAESGDRPKAQVFSLTSPLLSEGRTNNWVSRTEVMTVNLKVYAEGGENALHTHTSEDHCFVILQGEATFHDEDGNDTIVHKWEGITLPKGAYYYFTSTGDENLVLLRFGAKNGERTGDGGRVDIEGVPLPGESVENNHVVGVPIPGRYFGA